MPCSTIIWIVSSLASEPCSMQSTPGADARPDAGVAVRVGRDLEPGAVRLVDDRRELFVGVLLRAREPAVRHHAARTRRS